MKFWFIIVTISLFTKTTLALAVITDDALLKVFMENANKNLAELYSKQIAMHYEYEVDQPLLLNLTENNNIQETLRKYLKVLSKEIKSFDQNLIYDENLKREISKLPRNSYDVLDDNDLKELRKSIARMSVIYLSVKMCSYEDPNNCNLTLIPDVQDILRTSSDVDEIKYYWLEWRNKTKLAIKDSFEKFFNLYQKTAQLNNFIKPSQMWFKNFNEDNMIQILDSIMNEIQPFFIQFHARLRYLLRENFGKEIIKKSWPYPQHLSETIIGKSFLYDENECDIDFPYPEKGLPNITDILIEKEYTPKIFFHLATEFFTSIGMPEISEKFWTFNALPVADPFAKVLNCWNRAWHYYGIRNATISFCPDIDFKHFLNMYEVLTNVQYNNLFQNQPTVFQEEPLPNFGEAIEKVISMSASTPKYLEKIGLISNETFDDETRMNRLYLQGMRDIFVLPIFLLLDKYRIGILDNEISLNDNCAYWDLTEKYTGAIPPVKRSKDDFDGPAKLLLGVDDEYSSHFVAIIVQYQVYKHFCELTGEYEKGNNETRLDNCDLSNHTEIGEILRNAMSLGASKSWQDVLKVLTGQNKLDASGFLEYFQPLILWLEENNKENQEEIGWENVKQCE